MPNISREAYKSLLDKAPMAKGHHNKPESAITLSILKYLKSKGYPCGKIKTVGGRIGNKFIFDQWQWTGLPDILVFTPKLLFVEVKIAKGRQSDNQKWFQELCVKAQIPYLLVRSLGDIINFFGEI